MSATRFDLSTLKLRPVDEILHETEAFFMKEGKVHTTLKRLAQDLEDEGIPYAIIGGMALNLWGYTRETVDVDILLTRESLAGFIDRFVGRGYVFAFTGATKAFRDTQTQVKVEVITTGEYPGDGKPKPVAFPDPATTSIDRDGYRVISLEKLVELKLASGLTASHRLKDLADVQELIAILKLPLELAGQLDASVRAEYQRLWQGAQSAPPEEGMS
jgi:hypothetical protein